MTDEEKKQRVIDQLDSEYEKIREQLSDRTLTAAQADKLNDRLDQISKDLDNLA